MTLAKSRNGTLVGKSDRRNPPTAPSNEAWTEGIATAGAICGVVDIGITDIEGLAEFTAATALKVEMFNRTESVGTAKFGLDIDARIFELS